MIEQMIEEIRKTCISWWGKSCMSLGDLDAIAEKYKAKEPRWIPVEERLPDEDDRYLVIISHPFVKPFPAVAYYTTDAYTLDEHYFAKYKNEKKKIFFAFSENEGFVEAEDVIAWMPIPEYAKGDTE